MYELGQSPQQRLELRQYQLQRLEILAMSADELSEFLTQAEDENPLIEVERDRSEVEKELSLARWLNQRPVYECQFQDSDTDEPLEPEIPDDGDLSLERYLRLQIDFTALSASQRRMMSFLLGCLEDNGRLTVTPRQAADCCGLPAADAERCLTILRGLEPAGVCACCLKESLLAQLRVLPRRCPTAERLTETCLESVGGASVSGLAKKCGVTPGEIEAALGLLRTLEPYPGASFARAERMYVIPDVLVLPGRDGWEIRLCDKWSGTVSISRYYVQLLKGSHDKANLAYLYDRLQQAKALRTAIEQRRSTLLEISRLILERQQDFFQRGGPLRSLSLEELAQTLECHESTVSRALRGKYLRCPRGTFSLRKFIVSTVGESGVTNDSLARSIHTLISEEDKRAPLSDQQITEHLAHGGLAVSRRTIAKYRVSLGIPNAFARRA
jgi:RNA polymerase sigma-54 factor